jgi:hypothetical protein
VSIIPDVGTGSSDEELSRQLGAVRQVNSRLAEDPWQEKTYGDVFGRSGEGTLQDWIGQLTGNLRSITAAMPYVAGFSVQVAPEGVSVRVKFKSGAS